MHWHWLETAPDLGALGATFPDTYPYLLDSAARGALGRVSLLLRARGDALVLEPDGRLHGPGTGEGFLDRLAAWFRAEHVETAPMPAAVPFVGGWFVFLAYEMAGRFEPVLSLPPTPPGFPLAFAARCDGAVVTLHGAERDRHLLVAEDAPLLLRMREELRATAPSAPQTLPALDHIEPEPDERFADGVRRIHEYLRAGDVFQVNLSRAWRGAFASRPDPLALYAALRHRNPAPFGGYARWGEAFLASSSPERLVEVRGDRVQTRPIAGTRPRGRDASSDAALERELIAHPKERAEHIMLIDLERNDLGRVCTPGSVEVDELMVLESYAHVHHIVSNVRGRLRAGLTPLDAVRAVFPGGTITGCPKVRCMQIIAELEGAGRGIYTGAMGYLGRDGRMDLNILIRSLLLRGDALEFRTGAGIVADSDPAAELAETRAKARGLLLAVGAEHA